MLALFMLDLHLTWSWVVIVTNGVAGVWALAAHRWEAARVKALWWFTGAAELTMLVQVITGIVLLNKYELEAPEFHVFYGFVGLIAIAILFSYRSQLQHRIYLLYGFGSLFVMGLGIRAFLLSH